jgi:hypothetical protein
MALQRRAARRLGVRYSFLFVRADGAQLQEITALVETEGGPVGCHRLHAPGPGPTWCQVVGVYMGYVDTDMASGVDAAKAAPVDVVRQVLDGLEAGASEVLADEVARQVRAALHRPVDERYAAAAAG